MTPTSYFRPSYASIVRLTPSKQLPKLPTFVQEYAEAKHFLSSLLDKIPLSLHVSPLKAALSTPIQQSLFFASFFAWILASKAVSDPGLPRCSHSYPDLKTAVFSYRSRGQASSTTEVLFQPRCFSKISRFALPSQPRWELHWT